MTRSRGPRREHEETKTDSEDLLFVVCPLASFPEPPASAELRNGSTLSVSYDCRLKAFILKLFKM